MMHRLILALMWLLLGAAAHTQTAPAVTARIVPQSFPSGQGIEVAVWTSDSRFLITASGQHRSVLIWDVENFWLVDEIRLPQSENSKEVRLILSSMTLSRNGRTLRIDGQADNFNLPVVSAILDFRAARAFTVDLVNRRVTAATPLPLPPLAQGEAWDRWLGQRMDALGVIYGNMPTFSRAKADQLLPKLPRSPDGRYALLRTVPAWSLQRADGSLQPAPALPRRNFVYHAALAPDDRQMAMSSLHADLLDTGKFATRIDVTDINTGRFFPSIHLPPANYRLHWIDSRRYWALPENVGFEEPKNPTLSASGAPPPAVEVEAESGRVLSSVPARCFMAVLPAGGFVGAGLANCRRNVGVDRSLQRWTGQAWRPQASLRLPSGIDIRAIAVSPVGDRLALVLGSSSENLSIRLLDQRTGQNVALEGMDYAGVINTPMFSADGQALFFGFNRQLTRCGPAAGGDMMLTKYPLATDHNTRLVPTSGTVFVGGQFADVIASFDLATGQARVPVDVPDSVALGVMRGQTLMWAVSKAEGLRIWNSRTGNIVLSTLFLPDQRYISYAPDGRYDTNLGPDSESFRWRISDRPFQSLAPQTLMRDFYTPQMASKLLDCSAANNCAAVLPPLPALATLNRQLPVVRIISVQPADTPGQVVVRVEARETRDAQSGRPSGLFNVKLLLDKRQIDQQPPHFQQQPSPTLAEWRELNQMEGVNAAGVWTSEFQVSVPTHHDGKPMEFSAYAFNSDRVKSDTARLRWAPPATSTPKRPRRAWVLTIGVDDYVEPRLKLNFAVADARVIAERLAAIPGYEMRHINLTSAPAADGRPARQVTRADVLGVLSFLAGFPPEMNQMIRLEDVHKVRNLAETSPDDIVIISFSGHGFATATGQFALLPSNARWPATAAAPETRSVITAEDLTIQLGFMKAAEIAFIIDACHSGAAVNTPDFKPGPMGDASLGQLAFDKGLRILAATQADDVALENAALKQGFLTAALGEGLSDTGGPADLNNDGRIVLDEWLRYAVARLPSLHEDVRRGGGTMAARGVRLVMRTPTAQPKIQEPSLFDFNSAPSPVVLRGRALP